MWKESSYAKDLKMEYEQLRFRNRQLLNERIAEVHQQLPRIAEIDDEIRDLSIDAALAHEEPVVQSQLSSHIHALIDEKYRILSQAGYPDDYLSAIYTCPICKDTGYVGQEPCTCLKQRLIKRQYLNSNLGPNLAQENFDTFCSDYYSNEPDGIHELTPRANIENIYQSLHQFIAGINAYFQGDASKKGNILFQGGTGVGKTFLSKCVAKELLELGYTVLYLPAGALFEQISDAVMNKQQFPNSQELYQTIQQCDILMIDDLGTEFTNQFTASSFYTLVNNRLLQRKSTVISTNLSLTELRQHYSERIFSRICDSYMIYTIYGEDIRFIRRRNWQTES